MDKQIHPPTMPLLITEYYDSLIKELDIYTEERIKYYAEKVLPKVNVTTSDAHPIRNKFEIWSTYGVSSFKNPYESDDYTTFGQSYFTETPYKMTTTEYLNMVREKAIEEIRKAQEENLQYYRDNKEEFKVYRENLADDEKIEELRSNLFANRFCFLVYVEKIESTFTDENFHNWQRSERYLSLFKLHLVITDFFLAQSDIDLIRFD